jgi:hypothetical protein
MPSKTATSNKTIPIEKLDGKLKSLQKTQIRNGTLRQLEEAATEFDQNQVANNQVSKFMRGFLSNTYFSFVRNY